MLGRSGKSLLPAPAPEACRNIGGRSSQVRASAATSAMPVGVVSSPVPPACTRHPADSRTTAGTGTGRSPWAARVRPEPTATEPALTDVTPRSVSAAATPTTSAIESSAPTSWKWTSSVGMPWASASASASRANVARARVRTGSAMSASVMLSRIVAQRRWGRSSVITSTVILVAR